MRQAPIGWLFIGAFLLVCAVFLIAPTAMLAVQAVTDDDGLTLEYVRELASYRYVTAFEHSLYLSVLSATVGVVAGGLIAFAVLKEDAPRWLRSVVTRLMLPEVSA